jgi:transcriptional regulator with XRE-family HTH domain
VSITKSRGLLLKRNRYQSDYRLFIRRLRSARESAGLTQVEVAERLRVPQSFVSKCESGERRVDVIELRDFARIYGRKIADFLP